MGPELIWHFGKSKEFSLDEVMSTCVQFEASMTICMDRIQTKENTRIVTI